jgi:pentose-5-phosphate-3-epimerase
MKISASIYSDSSRPLKDVIDDLVQHQVDMLHVDCNDDLSVFEDIRAIRMWCDLPIDLHIITTEPEKYFTLLKEVPVEYVTFQYEQLSRPLELPADMPGKKGLAIITPTSVDVFDAYDQFDFILIMATIPGQSGGVFDRVNFSKIRQFRKRYPSKSIHVDGGVNGEVSFILRNMGVSSSVSGSYLFKGPSIGHALMNLTSRSIESHFLVEDFMIPLSESPVVSAHQLSLSGLLSSIENGNMGFCMVVGEDNHLHGIVSSADIRKGLLQHLEHITEIDPMVLVNEHPVTVQSEHTVVELLHIIKKTPFPVMYLPVVDKANKVVGSIQFVHLIKGEI